MQTAYLLVPLAPLLGAVLAGFFGPLIGRRGAHVVTIALMIVCFVLSVRIFQEALAVPSGVLFNGPVYTWLITGDVTLEVGFLIDRLSAIMMVVVSFVSLMVHVYTIGYMHEDPGYQRFFSYISLFTFSMLMLVMSNNFVQLFFGWEAVGLVSYLLIGFWYTRPTAIYANLKAFLVNRVGDFGFLLGIALVLLYFGSLDYGAVFERAPGLANTQVEVFAGHPWSLMTVVCILLFIGAMGKSAQFPLHVWLPDSMEGPTPISALIHAATMVTAGIFMVARMSPLFEMSQTALSFVLVIGAITALSMALVAITQHDIKRVVAFSTLSQLGYMTMALGASAYAAAVFHLFTHAFFKAVLFLGAGSVIVAMHHEQDMRRMGGLRKYMPITYLTVLIGAIANAGLPPFAGFFSKDTIIEAIHSAQLPGAGFAYVAAVTGVFIGALYSFRLVFVAFHGHERFEVHGAHHGHGDAEHGHGDGHHGGVPKESPWVITLPLIMLAIPSVAAGWLVGGFVHGGYFGGAIVVGPQHGWINAMSAEFHGVVPMVLHGLTSLPFWLAVLGLATAWYCYILRPDVPAAIVRRFPGVHRMLDRKYWIDELYSWAFAGGARRLGTAFWKFGDVVIIDGLIVNGTARLVGWLSSVIRHFQSGYIYHYAFTMIIGVLVLLTLLLFVRG